MKNMCKKNPTDFIIIIVFTIFIYNDTTRSIRKYIIYNLFILWAPKQSPPHPPHRPHPISLNYDRPFLLLHISVSSFDPFFLLVQLDGAITHEYQLDSLIKIFHSTSFVWAFLYTPPQSLLISALHKGSCRLKKKH